MGVTYFECNLPRCLQVVLRDFEKGKTMKTRLCAALLLTATVRLPDGTAKEVGSGEHVLSCDFDVSKK